MSSVHSNRSLFFVSILGALLSSLPLVSARQGVCSLCEDGLAGLKYPYAVIKSDGTTCTSLAMEIAMNYEDGEDGCYKQMEAWRQICCGDDEPIDVEITEVFDLYPDIDSIEKIGSNDKCDLCRDGDYPSAESMVIHMLYIGAGTCPQYWKAGQQGLIPNHMCDPLRYFAYEPCGCGEFSTNGNYNWGDSYSGDTPSDKDDDEAPWWSGANGNTGSGDWWSSANGNHGKTDDEAPWWAGADSASGANNQRHHAQSLVSLLVPALVVYFV